MYLQHNSSGELWHLRNCLRRDEIYILIKQVL